jgi:hypothetical protein
LSACLAASIAASAASDLAIGPGRCCANAGAADDVSESIITNETADRITVPPIEDAKSA